MIILSFHGYSKKYIVLKSFKTYTKGIYKLYKYIASHMTTNNIIWTDLIACDPKDDITYKYACKKLMYVHKLTLIINIIIA